LNPKNYLKYRGYLHMFLADNLLLFLTVIKAGLNDKVFIEVWPKSQT